MSVKRRAEGQQPPPRPDVPDDVGEIIKGVKSSGSDAKFIETAAKAYGEAEKKYGAEAPAKLSKGFDDAVEAGKLSKETAEIFKSALKESKNAQEFAQRLNKDRDQLASSFAKDTSKPGFDLKDNPFMAMMVAMIAKLLGMNPKDFGINVPDMKGKFANANGGGSGRPSTPKTADPAAPKAEEREGRKLRVDGDGGAAAVAPTLIPPAAQSASPADFSSSIRRDGPFTTTGPSTGPLNFSFDNQNLLTNMFAIPANPDPNMVARVPAFGLVSSEQSLGAVSNNEVIAKAKVEALGIGT